MEAKHIEVLKDDCIEGQFLAKACKVHIQTSESKQYQKAFTLNYLCARCNHGCLQTREIDWDIKKTYWQAEELEVTTRINFYNLPSDEEMEARCSVEERMSFVNNYQHMKEGLVFDFQVRKKVYVGFRCALLGFGEVDFAKQLTTCGSFSRKKKSKKTAKKEKQQAEPATSNSESTVIDTTAILNKQPKPTV